MASFTSLEEMMASVSAIVRPSERLTVSQSAEKYRRINNPGSYVGPWDNKMAPYLVEVMDTMTSLEFTGIAFAGPARSGKSDIFFNWLSHTAITDPADMMIVHMTQTVARDWSQKDLRRSFRHSPELGSTVMPGRHNQSTYDVRFRSGMHLLVKHPTVSELSGKTIPRLWIADYDRIADDIDGEGNAFNLAKRRSQTFRRYAMTVAESSPGRDISDPKWMPPVGSHMAPPCGGILDLYNGGDRRRWMWPCPQCSEPFEPDFKHLHYDDTPDIMAAADSVVMVCPHCGGIIPHDSDPEKGLPGKHEMNLRGRWIREGQTWHADGTITGTPVRADIASFWLKGPAAVFADWRTMVVEYLMALETYERTGDEGPLRVAINTGQGLPYSPRVLMSGRLPEDVKSLARDIGEKVVPEGVRFLQASIDVQANRFEVQVHGFTADKGIVIIDRFAIRKSRRLDEDGDPLPLRPDAYDEDWDILIDEVILRTYELGDDSGRRMSIKIVACDSGGKEGVTSRAYDFWRRLRNSDGEQFPPRLHLRFRLVKGGSNKTAPRVMQSFPDSERKDRAANARGEIPVLLMNTLLLKDQVDKMLGGRDDEGNVLGAKLTFAKWLPDWFYAEFCAETRTEKGWQNLTKARNEAFDLVVYAIASCLPQPVRWEHLAWDDPEPWYDEWDYNDLVFSPETGKSINEVLSPPVDTSLSDLARLLT